MSTAKTSFSGEGAGDKKEKQETLSIPGNTLYYQLELGTKSLDDTKLPNKWSFKVQGMQEGR